MRVLFAGGHGYYPELVGGVESSTDFLAKKLIETGHIPAVSAALFGNSLFGMRQRLMLKMSKKRYVRDAAPGYDIYRSWFPWETASAVIDSFRPDVAVVQCHKTVPIARAIEATGIPVVIYLRNVEFDEMQGDLRDLTNATYIANSRFTDSRYREAFGVEAEVIPPMIDIGKYATETSREFVTLVNLYPEKGYERALAIARACPDISFLFLEGWALNEEYLSKVREDLAPLANVTFMRRTSDMRRVYGRTRILLAPSKWEEAWGRVASEAHCSGIPVVGSSRGGLPEAIGPGGIVLDYDAPLEAWTGAVRRLWSDEAAYGEASKAALDYSRRPQLNADDQFQTFLSVLGRAAETRPTATAAAVA